MTPVTSPAISEIEALGFQVTAQPRPGTVPYLALSGRSNPRWWLVPLDHRHATASSFALFQPILASAKLMKSASVIASKLGAAPLLSASRLHVSGAPELLADLFRTRNLSYAFFTGTDSPHRKATVQIMDRNGHILGYAKVTRNPLIKPLIEHEATMLDHLKGLDLQTANTPNVLFMGNASDATVLVTDTQKTPQSKTRTSLIQAHIDFLNELALKTASTGENQTAGTLRSRYEKLAPRLTVDWQQRIERCLNHLAGHGDSLGPSVLSHGDFTPWNTFFSHDRLYVFDWEYASHNHPAGYDLIHYLLSLPANKKQTAKSAVSTVLAHLSSQFHKSPPAATAILMAYFCGHTLHYTERALTAEGVLQTWDNAERTAMLIDALPGRKN